MRATVVNKGNRCTTHPNISFSLHVVRQNKRDVLLNCLNQQMAVSCATGTKARANAGRPPA